MEKDVEKAYVMGATLLLVLLLAGSVAVGWIVWQGSRDARVLLPTDHVAPIVPIAPVVKRAPVTAPTAPTTANGSQPAAARTARSSRG